MAAALLIIVGVRCAGSDEVVAPSGSDVVPDVEGQPLAANVARLIRALDFLGAPLDAELVRSLERPLAMHDAGAIQRVLDPVVLFHVGINPELRVKVRRGDASAELHQNGFSPALVKVRNEALVSERLRISSPQAGPVYAGAAEAILARQQQTHLNEGTLATGAADRFFDVDMFTASPMTERLSGLRVEYAIALLYSSESGRREATVGFDVGQGTQDIGFRGEVPVLFNVRQAVGVRLAIRDVDGSPTTARLTIRDAAGRIQPPQAKRLAPDLFFQPQVYRSDGDIVLLPEGRFSIAWTRGPEYVERSTTFTVAADAGNTLHLDLERWIDPAAFGFFSGDHHIHGAGCSHYTSPSEGVSPRDMFLQVKGEGLNVGCVLTWGPCFDFQRRFFSPGADAVSEPRTILKYDLEISGFGSEALGHVCLLNLRDQTYPGSEGTKSSGWPTWTVPVMQWAKAQGGVTGYPHSDLFVDPEASAARLVARHDSDGDRALSTAETEAALLPAAFPAIDTDESGTLSADELRQSADRAAGTLPNLVLPAMHGAGAMEIFVSAAEGACDFISAMNTARIGEWNTWYHLLNCGLPIKLSGETDFPCMSGTRVGQGRVYVRMTPEQTEPAIDYAAWCRGLAEGRSYVSDGFAHAVEFTVGGLRPGERPVEIATAGNVLVAARVAFASVTPAAVAHGTLESEAGLRVSGDTRVMHAPKSDATVRGGERLVELVVNGEAVAARSVPADGRIHDLAFEIPIAKSSWVALRHFPQLHTNPVDVLVADAPIRASRESARWCAEAVDLLWENRSRFISEAERPAAEAAYQRAIALYRERGLEARNRLGAR